MQAASVNVRVMWAWNACVDRNCRLLGSAGRYMPQPKSSSGRSRKQARATSVKSAKRDEENLVRLTALRDMLARAVMLPSERVREAMDDAVRRGRMTRDDAEELASSLIALGRR